MTTGFLHTKMAESTPKITRDYSLTNALRWQAAQAFVNGNWAACLAAGNPLRVIVSTEAEKRRDAQNKYYFAGVIVQIADQVVVNGHKFGKLAWHEHYADMFAPLIEIILPGGEVKTRRKSTTEMLVKEFSDYTTAVEADAAQEHGVMFYVLESL